MADKDIYAIDEINVISYAYWRKRLMYSLIIGYAAFYCVRQNFSLVIADKDFPFSAESMGWGFSLFSIIYGFGKFFSGMLCDRFNVRAIMSIGLIGAAITSLIAGFTNSALFMGLLYAINACFQSVGWPAVTNSLTQWYGPKEIGFRWGIVNSSHQIGSIIILIVGAWLIEKYNWTYIFIAPGLCCLVVGIYLYNRLRGGPHTLNLPPIEVFENLDPSSDNCQPFTKEDAWWPIFKKYIIFNYRLWMVCIAKFFVYFVRMGYFFWGPKIIAETQGGALLKASYKTAIFELAGLFGGIFVGWYTDKYMPKRRCVCGIYMMCLLAVTLSIYLFLLKNGFREAQYFNVLDSFFWGVVGFCVYGSQVLGGLSGAEFGSRKAAATALGLTGASSYLGACLVGIGVPKIAKNFGWESVYFAFIITAALGALFFALAQIKRPCKNV